MATRRPTKCRAAPLRAGRASCASAGASSLSAHLYDYADHVVFRHEQTFPKHKSDRLALFKATRAYCEQIYLLYSDPTFTAEQLIFGTASGTALSAAAEGSAAETAGGQSRPADLEVVDEYGVVHRVWKTHRSRVDPAGIGRHG